nr:uncharacterized protein LOC113804016 isoform X2 [Penaeus vannamei]
MKVFVRKEVTEGILTLYRGFCTGVSRKKAETNNVFPRVSGIGQELERTHPKLYNSVARQLSITLTSDKFQARRGEESQQHASRFCSLSSRQDEHKYQRLFLPRRCRPIRYLFM